MWQLFIQLVLGSVLIGLASAVQAFGAVMLMRHRPHLGRRIGRLNAAVMIAVMSASGLWMLAWQTVGVWLWAVALQMVDAFQNLETALYFALAAYTTLGFGDVLPPDDWRIFGALIGANGMLGFGMAIAVLVAFVEGLRDDLNRAQSSEDDPAEMDDRPRR